MIGSEILSPFQRTLEEDGYEVVLRAPGETADSDNYSPDVILLDLAAGAEDTEVKRILQEAQTGVGPAVIAVIDPERPPSFDPALGLDDFLATTASPGELTLRLRQALWRRTGVDARNVLRCGDLEMDLANYTVHIAGQPVDLTYKEYELLRFLATSPDRVFNRETLLNKVWGYDFYGGSRTVDVHIRRLRSKIEDRHHTFIETVRNVGYRFRA
ncbi:MAG: response regulator transcription factor [Chloroflexi bacterium]|nr:response regulator transcription factor [Chloroflexota bacterium]